MYSRASFNYFTDKMPKITDNVRPELSRLIPSSLLMEVNSFVFYDNHPKDQKLIDVIVATSNGEIKEFYRRDLVHNLNLGRTSKPVDIRIVRNGNCDLFYLVEAGDELIIVSRKQKPEIHRRVQNVEKYSIEDGVCRGQGILQVILKDDGVPLVFDDNFMNLGDKAFVLDSLHADESLPILTELMRKLTETKFSVKRNESTLKELLSLRQASALASYKKIHPNTDESLFNMNSSKEDDILKLKSLTPWVKMCNKKIVLALMASYSNSIVAVEDIHILLHGTNRKSMVYTTKLFEKTKSAPSWRKMNTQSLTQAHDIAIVCVVELEEIAMNYQSKIEFDGVVSYMRMGKEYVMPFDHFILTSMDIMGDNFDALAGIDMDDEMLSLAVVATTIKTDLLLRHIRAPDEQCLQIADSFCEYLHMTKMENTDRVIIYRQSPYHILNGVLLVFSASKIIDDCYPVSVYARSTAQVVALIHFIHDAMPHKIITTTPEMNICPKSEKHSKYPDENHKKPPKINYNGYASSLLKQSELLLEYFDKCMSKMSESKDPDIRSKIGSEIDIMAGGVASFMEFRTSMLGEALKGVKGVKTDVKADIGVVSDSDPDVDMLMD